jgi:hypothetical protein
MAIRIVRFNMTKSREDYNITLDKVAKAAKWDEDQVCLAI